MAKKKKDMIDIIQKALKKSGYDIKRMDWGESYPIDKAQWLDVSKGEVDENGKLIVVHLYFEDGKSLSEIEVWKQKWELQENIDKTKRIM